MVDYYSNTRAAREQRAANQARAYLLAGEVRKLHAREAEIRAELLTLGYSALPDPDASERQLRKSVELGIARAVQVDGVDYLSVAAAARALGRNPASIRNFIKRGTRGARFL